MTTISAGSVVVSVTVKGFDRLGADSCARGSGASFHSGRGLESLNRQKNHQNMAI